MATQAEVLEKVGEYCTEKQYTLNDDFRSKFSDKFAAANAEADITDENVLNSIKFNLDTAFSAASQELKVKDETWKTKEAEYLKQIETLKKNSKEGNSKTPKKDEGNVDIPENVKLQLAELDKFKNERLESEKRTKVLTLAKKDVREDLYGDLESVLDVMKLDYSKEEKYLAKELNENFTKLYKGKISNISPASSNSKTIKDEDILANVKKVKI